MITFLLILLGAMIGWYGRVLFAVYQLKRLALQLQELEKTVDHLGGGVGQERVLVNIEKKDDTYYVYDSKTETFLAQGKTLDDINNILDTRFPNVAFIADYDCLEGLVKGDDDESI